MREYMNYIEHQFYTATDWNPEHSYARITETAKNLIDFKIPAGVSLNVSSQSSLNSFTSYTLSNLGIVNGSIAYLYSSKSMDNVVDSKRISLHDHFVTSYKLLEPLRRPEQEHFHQRWLAGKRVDSKESLLYGRIFLPGNSLEAMMIKRLSYWSQLLVTCVSDTRLKNNGALTFTYQRDMGKYSQELIYSTHEALIGARGLYNFGDYRVDDATNAPRLSRLSLGMELYYGIMSKAPGLSTALRYTTQSAYTGTPLTMTVMCNPLMGHISATYALRTNAWSSFASRFDFNVYSYLSDLTIGCEVWRKKQLGVGEQEKEEEPYTNVIKASASVTSQKVKVLWEGKYQDFLVSCGLGLSGNKQELTPTMGIEFLYSS